MRFVLSLKKYLNLKNIAKKRVEVFGEQYLSFGLFGAINYPVFYLVWLYLSSQVYENLILRLIAALLCLPLVFHKYWPKKLMSWRPLYWYVTLLYCLPFFFTFMLLKNNDSDVWLMSTTIVMVWLMLLVDSLSFLVLLVLGTMSAWVAYRLTGALQFQPADYLGLIIQYFGTLSVVLIFARKKEQLYERKLRLKAEASSRAKSEFYS